LITPSVGSGSVYYVVVITAVIFCLVAATNDRLRAPVISSGYVIQICWNLCSQSLSFANLSQVTRSYTKRHVLSNDSIALQLHRARTTRAAPGRRNSEDLQRFNSFCSSGHGW
jgi:hypothetical protein